MTRTGHYVLQVWVWSFKKQRLHLLVIFQSWWAWGDQTELCVTNCVTRKRQKEGGDQHLSTSSQTVNPRSTHSERAFLQVHNANFYFLQHHNVSEVEQRLFPEDIKVTDSVIPWSLESRAGSYSISIVLEGANTDASRSQEGAINVWGWPGECQGLMTNVLYTSAPHDWDHEGIERGTQIIQVFKGSQNSGFCMFLLYF